MDEQLHKKLDEHFTPKRPIVKNCVKAFFIGGLFCTVGQAISYFYMYFFPFTEKTVGNPTAATMIFIAMLLTGFGLYSKIAQIGGAGSAVPVTGFGNAVISAAIEHKSEGFVLGLGGNMFKLAGAVILYGVVAAFVVGLVKMFFVSLGVASW